MRSASTALKNFLATRQPFWSADLFTIVLVDGTTINVCSTDIDISYSGTTWHASGPTFTRGSWRMTSTIDVPDLQIQIASSGSDYSVGNFKLLAHNGYLDGAQVTLYRAVMTAPGNTAMGIVTLFSGLVSQIDIDGIGIKMTVKSQATILQQYMPRNVYTAGCSWALYGSGCTLSRAAHTAIQLVNTGTITSTVIPIYGSWILPSLATTPVSTLILGTFIVVTGAAAGQRRPIVGGADGAGAYIQLGYPLYTLPAVGDQVYAIMGCNKTQTTCNNVFGNLQHYRGFDYIPPAETAY